MGCCEASLSKDTKDILTVRTDHIEEFDYTHGCSDWEEHFHLHLVFKKFFSFNLFCFETGEKTIANRYSFK